MVVHRINLNNSISCVVGISILGFNKYWKAFLNLMDLNMSPTFKQFLQFETVNSEKKIILSTMQCKKNESLPQTGNDETENMREHTCKENWYGLQSMHTSWKILVVIEESKALTKSNQPKKSNQKQQIRCWCGSIKHLHITTRDFHVGLSYWKAKNWPWGWGYIKIRQIRQHKTQQQRKRGNVWWRVGCGEWIIIWGGISSKYGI